MSFIQPYIDFPMARKTTFREELSLNETPFFFVDEIYLGDRSCASGQESENQKTPNQKTKRKIPVRSFFKLFQVEKNRG